MFSNVSVNNDMKVQEEITTNLFTHLEVIDFQATAYSLINMAKLEIGKRRCVLNKTIKNMQMK